LIVFMQVVRACVLLARLLARYASWSARFPHLLGSESARVVGERDTAAAGFTGKRTPD
jgi:hypothetical protein